MKILIISEYFPPVIQGGGEINIFEIAKALAQKGIEIHVLTSAFPNLKRKERICGINIHRRLKSGRNPSKVISNFKRHLLFSKSIIKNVNKLKIEFDIIHLIGRALQAAPSIKRITKTPLVTTVESYIALCPKGDFIYKDQLDISHWNFLKFIKSIFQAKEIGKIKNKLYLRLNPLFWLIVYYNYQKMFKGLKDVELIAISGFIQELLKNNHNLNSTIIPNFVDLKKFSLTNIQPKSKGKPTVLYLGSLTKYKGPQILIEAVEGLDCKTLLYGSGGIKDELLSYINEHKLDAQIKKPVPYEQVPKIYSKADLVVFPSLWPEPFGRITIEAGAARKPIIGSRVGAIQETILDNGLLVKPGDVAELQKALKELIKDRHLATKMGAKGRELVEKKYSKEIVIKKLIDFYDEKRKYSRD